MASQEITGKTEAEIEELKQAWEERHPERPFEDNHCLHEVPKQPEDYTGPVRYCTLQRDLHETASGDILCKFHGGKHGRNYDGLEKLAAMKHGMKATREHLIEDFDEKDRALYDWIVEEWPKAYDIDTDQDPQAELDFHRLAVEVVRGERGRGYLIEEGEVHEDAVRNEEGRVVIDDDGEVVTEKSEHYLAQMLHRQDKKISQIEKELGITRKERLKQDSTDSAIEAMKSFAELGGVFIDRDEHDYDPEEQPWAEEDGQDS